MLLNHGVQDRIFGESPSGAGSLERGVSIESDSILVTLYAQSVAGTLDVSVYASTDDSSSSEAALLFSFPQLSSATSQLLLRRSSITTSRIRIKATYSDACQYEIYARAVNSGSSDTRILGAADFEVSQVTVGTTPLELIPVSLVDRAGLLIKNWSTTQTVYLAESSLKATSGVGYPLGPRDALAVDLSAGVAVWAVADASGADVRLAESGG